MKASLPSLKSSDKELEEIYEKQSGTYLEWLAKNSISPNSSKDIETLAHNELVKRSNNKFSRRSLILTRSVIGLSIVTLFFAFFDFAGDRKWQDAQLEQLELINHKLTEKDAEIYLLKAELDKAIKISSPIADTISKK